MFADWIGRMNPFGKALAKTRNAFLGGIDNLFGASEVTDETWESLEELLIQSDVGPEVAIGLVDSVREKAKDVRIRSGEDVERLLKQEMLAVLDAKRPRADEEPRLLTVILVVGVNGSGKTTSVGKLARYYGQKGHKVMLAAADTFRAAAIDQLKIWGERAGVPVIAHQPNSDPGAVVYDAIRASRARGADMLIADTAGRLHTKFNLMAELRKVADVARRAVHSAPHEVYLVLDATTGQNAIAQAKHFKDAAGLTGVVLAKLDGTAKGGVVFAIARELGVPVRFVGTGEGIDDLAEFDAKAFVDGLFEKE
jgi:fused signal recognition particle receptor